MLSEDDKEAIIYVGGRLRRAILTLTAVPDKDRKWIYSERSSWPEIVRAVEDAYGYQAVKRPKFRPTSRDVDEMLPALDWLAWLGCQKDGKREVAIIWARALGTPWWKLAERYGKSEKQVRRWQDGAITAIWLFFRDQIPRVDKMSQMSDISG